MIRFNLLAQNYREKTGSCMPITTSFVPLHKWMDSWIPMCKFQNSSWHFLTSKWFSDSIFSSAKETPGNPQKCRNTPSHPPPTPNNHGTQAMNLLSRIPEWYRLAHSHQISGVLPSYPVENWRSIPNDRLHIPIGSTCMVCRPTFGWFVWFSCR